MNTIENMGSITTSFWKITPTDNFIFIQFLLSRLRPPYFLFNDRNTIAYIIDVIILQHAAFLIFQHDNELTYYKR